MKTIKTEWNFGNFTVSLSTALEEEQLEVLAEYGLRWLSQRTPASEAEKALAAGGFTDTEGKQQPKWEVNGKGTPKRPTGFNRGSIPFNADNAAMVEAAFSTIEAGEGDGKFAFDPTVVVTEYVAEKPELKYREEKDIIKAKGGDKERLRALAEKVEYELEDGATLDENNLNFVLKVRAYLRDMKAAI